VISEMDYFIFTVG